MPSLTTLGIILAAMLGGVLGYALRLLSGRRMIDSAEQIARRTVADAETTAKKMLLDAKERALAAEEESKRSDEARRAELRGIQQKLERCRADYDRGLLELRQKEEELAAKHAGADAQRSELAAQLEAVAAMTKEEAANMLFAQIEASEEEAFANRLRKIHREQEDALERQAREMLSGVIQRVAASHAVDTTTTCVMLPTDDMKGRIIGKEGRNIKAIEHLTGTEIIIDDTPGQVTVSGFSPIRRQVAKLAIHKLLADGRVHPGRIEEAVEEAKKDIAVDIKKAGEDALYELGIPVNAFDPKLVQILGRLKYRTSYGQNQLRHSIEVAQLAGLLAEELGADVIGCKKGGILHDIGKAVDHDVPGGHPQIGYDLMKKFGLPEDLCYQSIGHHEDKPRTLEAIIVKAADAISGARPGARKDSHELYVQRLEELEKAAKAFPGVEKVYAIQAGREVRVFVSPDSVDDFAAHRLAKDIAQKIESEMRYPGEIRVNVIRETRSIEYAR